MHPTSSGYVVEAGELEGMAVALAKSIRIFAGIHRGSSSECVPTFWELQLSDSVINGAGSGERNQRNICGFQSLMGSLLVKERSS